VFFLHFSVEYTGTGKQNRKILIAFYGMTLSYIVLNTLTGIFTSGTSFRDAYAYPTPAFLYPVYFATFVASVIYGAVLMLRSGKSMERNRKNALWIYLVAHILGYSGGMNYFLIMFDMRFFPLHPYGGYFIALYAAVSLVLLQQGIFLEPTAEKAQASQLAKESSSAS